MIRVRPSPETVTAWAWEVKETTQRNAGRWALCYWTMPTKAHLLDEKKPSPEARPVCVRVIRNRDWRARALAARIVKVAERIERRSAPSKKKVK